MQLQYTAMPKRQPPKRHPQIIALEERLGQERIGRAYFFTAAKLYSQKYQNWVNRGIPSAELFNVARIANMDPEALAEGRNVPVRKAPEWSTRGDEILLKWRSLPERSRDDFEKSAVELLDRLIKIAGDYEDTLNAFSGDFMKRRADDFRSDDKKKPPPAKKKPAKKQPKSRSH